MIFSYLNSSAGIKSNEVSKIHEAKDFVKTENSF